MNLTGRDWFRLHVWWTVTYALLAVAFLAFGEPWWVVAFPTFVSALAAAFAWDLGSRIKR